MIKRAICFLMTFVMVFGLLPVSSLAEEEFISYPVELKTKDSDFIRNCKLEVKFSDSGIAMAKFDDLCDLLDLESRVVSDLYYVCRKKGLVTGTEPENPVGDEEDRVLNRYQLVFLDGAKNAVQLNCIFGSQGIPLIESPMKINGSLYVPLASFVRLNNGYVRVDNNKIILTQPHETVTDILGWEENRSLWGKYFFDPIECIKEKSEFLGKNPAKVVYIWDGIYEAFHDIFDAIFTLNFSGLDEIYSGDYAISYGEVMAQTICSKTSDELVGIEEKKEFGKLSIDAMQAFTDMVAESSGDVIKDLEFRSEYIFSEMLNKNIAMESGFDQIGELADRIGKQRSEQAFYKALSSKALMRSAGAAFCIFSSYCSITNELDRISNYDIDAMSRYIRISQNKNTEIEAVKVRKGLEDKVEWLSSMRYSTFSDKLTDAVVNELESLAWDDIGNNVSMAVSMFPKGKALSGGLTYKAIGLLWDLADVVIDNTFGDLGKAKIAINLCMLIDSVKQTYLKDDSSGQDKYDNRLALIYVYLKSCYASRDLILDESYAKFKRHCPRCKNILAYNDVKCSKCGKCDKETDYHNEDSGYYNFFADDLAIEEKLGALLGKLTTTTDMGTDQKLIDGLKPFDSYFSKKLSEVDLNSVSDSNNAVVVSDGASTYAIKNDGTLWAWGYTGDGRLGDGTTQYRETPVKIMDGVHTVSMGYGYTFAIKNDGSLWGWGINQDGQLGDGTTNNRYQPIYILDDASQIVTSGGFYYNRSYVIKRDGTLWGWGYNEDGSLGDGTLINRLSPVFILNDVVSIHTTGGFHGVCYQCFAVRSDGSLFGWGASAYHESFPELDSMFNASLQDWFNNNKEWIGLDNLQQALDRVCFVLGNGTSESSHSPIFITDNVKTINTIDRKGTTFHLGEEATFEGITYFIIKEDNSLWAWGRNGGLLGDGTIEDKLSPVPIMSNVKEIKTTPGLWIDAKAVLCQKEDNSLWSWGSDDLTGTGKRELAPVKVFDKILHFDVNDYQAFVVDLSGVVWGWGQNILDWMPIGVDSNEQVHTPVPITDSAVTVYTQYNYFGTGADDVTYTYILKSDSSLWGWGATSSDWYEDRSLGIGPIGCLGDGTKLPRNTPVHIIDGVYKVLQLWRIRLIILNDGSLWQWGEYGERYGTYVESPIKMLDRVML